MQYIDASPYIANAIPTATLIYCMISTVMHDFDTIDWGYVVWKSPKVLKVASTYVFFQPRVVGACSQSIALQSPAFE
jgi:hypothetical protein